MARPAFITGDKFDRDQATGQDLLEACNNLPTDKQAEVFSKELDVEIVKEEEWTKRFQALNQADESGKITRPKIALMMAWAVCIPVYVMTLALSIAIAFDNKEMVNQIKETWPLILAMLGTPTALLYAYFGMRRDEKKARYNLAAGQSSPLGVIGNIISSFKR